MVIFIIVWAVVIPAATWALTKEQYVVSRVFYTLAALWMGAIAISFQEKLTTDTFFMVLGFVMVTCLVAIGLIINYDNTRRKK